MNVHSLGKILGQESPLILSIEKKQQQQQKKNVPKIVITLMHIHILTFRVVLLGYGPLLHWTVLHFKCYLA